MDRLGSQEGQRKADTFSPASEAAERVADARLRHSEVLGRTLNALLAKQMHENQQQIEVDFLQLHAVISTLSGPRPF